jgi:hypothetical protein
MPRRDGDVFLLGTAISVSFSSLNSENWHRPETGGSSAGAQAENADEAALIEDDVAEG